MLDVYPPWGQPMFDTGQNLLALSYRLVYTILGGYITAGLAPHRPMRHVLILGIIGFVMATAGARKGYCLALLGCRGMTTRNACSSLKWNQGTSYPMYSGHGCIGCSEPNFWDKSDLYRDEGATPDPDGICVAPPVPPIR